MEEVLKMICSTKQVKQIKKIICVENLEMGKCKVWPETLTLQMICGLPTVFQWQLTRSLSRATSRSTSCPTSSRAPATLWPCMQPKGRWPAAQSSPTSKHVSARHIVSMTKFGELQPRWVLTPTKNIEFFFQVNFNIFLHQGVKAATKVAAMSHSSRCLSFSGQTKCCWKKYSHLRCDMFGITW